MRKHVPHCPTAGDANQRGRFVFNSQYSVSLAIDSRHETANMHVVKVENANATDG